MGTILAFRIISNWGVDCRNGVTKQVWATAVGILRLSLSCRSRRKRSKTTARQLRQQGGSKETGFQPSPPVSPVSPRDEAGVSVCHWRELGIRMIKALFRHCAPSHRRESQWRSLRRPPSLLDVLHCPAAALECRVEAMNGLVRFQTHLCFSK
jgi:hypothetical protein